MSNPPLRLYSNAGGAKYSWNFEVGKKLRALNYITIVRNLQEKLKIRIGLFAANWSH